MFFFIFIADRISGFTGNSYLQYITMLNNRNFCFFDGSMQFSLKRIRWIPVFIKKTRRSQIFVKKDAPLEILDPGGVAYSLYRG